MEQELDIMQLEYTNKLNRGQARVHDYYCNVIEILSEKDAHREVVQVAKLALSDLLRVCYSVAFMNNRASNTLRKRVGCY